VQRFDIVRDSAGAGRQRGGIGHVREYRLLVDCILTARTSNHHQGASGLNGGEGPPLSRTVINPDTPQQEEMDCMETRVISAGTVVRLQQAGGAGYGNPLERPVDLVIADVENGYVSTVAAKKQYGVGDANVDRKQTQGDLDC
jgi:N-methylhydantoinase B